MKLFSCDDNSNELKEFSMNEVLFKDLNDEFGCIVFNPLEISIETGCEFSTGDGQLIPEDDIRMFIQNYFQGYIESILYDVIEHIRAYGDDVV